MQKNVILLLIKMVKAIKTDSKIKMETSHHNVGSSDRTRKNNFQRIAIHFAGTFVGQTVLMQFDKMLWSLEKTASWISNSKTGKMTIKNHKNKKKHFNKRCIKRNNGNYNNKTTQSSTHSTRHNFYYVG